jgi:hypothetical protein
MKYILPLILILAQSVALNANVNFTFEGEANGTNLNVSSNSGTTAGAWNFGGPTVQAGKINIGYTEFYKWTANTPTVSDNLSDATRTFTLASPITDGEFTYEIEISDFDLLGSWGSNPPNSGKGITFVIADSAGIGAKVSVESLFIPVPVPLTAIKVVSNEFGTGAPNATQAQTTTLQNGTALTLQITVNAATGTWTSRAKATSSDTWVDLTQDGSGLADIASIQLKTAHLTNDPWGDATLAGGTAGDFVKIDSLSLSGYVAPTTTDIDIQSNPWGSTANKDLTGVAGTLSNNLIGETDLSSQDAVTMQIAADLDTGIWQTRYKVGAGDWNDGVIDGTGLTDVSEFKIKVNTPSGQAWGEDAATVSDFVKVDSIKLLNGDFASVDTANPLIDFGFNDAAGSSILAIADDPATADVDESVAGVTNAGSATGVFNFPGHLTNGNGSLNVGYTGSNTWLNNFSNSFRSFALDSSITTGKVVFEVVIAEYDLSNAWNSASDSYSDKGVQFTLLTENQAGGAVSLYSDNKLVPGSVFQLDFNDEAPSTLQATTTYGVTGTWNFGGPRTSGDGNLNIGYTESNKWTDLYGTGDSGNAYRTFEFTDAITSGRYIIEAKINAADLSGSWTGGELVANKGFQMIAKKADGSGAVLNLYSHISGSTGGYQVKAQSNIWAGTASSVTAGDGLKQAFGLPATGEIDLQLVVNVSTGQWSARAKATSSSTWKPLEIAGEGLTDIKQITLNAKTPQNSAGTGLALWGDSSLEAIPAVLGDDPATTEVVETDYVITPAVPGTAGDYVELDHIRILEDSTPDANNDIVVTGKTFGSSETTSSTAVSVETNNFAQVGSDTLLKIDADLDTGNWTSQFSTDDGATWINLVTDGVGLTEVANITMSPKHVLYDSWGTDETGGVTSDFVEIDSITLTTTSADGDVVIDFEGATGNLSTYGSATGPAGSWNFGGPSVNNGLLNIGYTKFYKWNNQGDLSQAFRKYIFTSPITAGSVSLIVDIKSYDLSRAWDNDSANNTNSLSGKGMHFSLQDSNAVGAEINLFTQNESPTVDTDSDGIPDFADDYPTDPNNGVTPTDTGVLSSSVFDDVDGTLLNVAADTGDDFVNLLSSQKIWQSAQNGPYVDSGNIGIGYTENNKFTDVNAGNKFRTKWLKQEVTTGVVVYETVVSAYDLSKSWDAGSSAAGKGYRMILKRGNGGSNDPTSAGARQGAAINLQVSANGGMEIQGQTWFTGDAVVSFGGNVTVDLNEADQASDTSITMQIVVDTDTGAWYSRFSTDGGSTWTALVTDGSGFDKIRSLQIANRTPSGDSWGTDTTAGVASDFVKVSSITVTNITTTGDSSVATPTLPSDVTDTDSDGVYDYADDFPNDATENTDADGDGVGANADPDDSDPNVPNAPAPSVAPALSISSDGASVTLTWEDAAGFEVHSSSDLSAWTNEGDSESPYTESQGAGGKFFKLANE